MKNNPKHNHHYLPQFYLKYWANDANKVWVYDLHPLSESHQRNPHLLHTKKICSEDNLYLIGDNESVEDWASENIENSCAPIFEKINKIEQIDENDILYTKSFLALTMARHPLMKESSELIVKSIPQEKELINPLVQTVRFRFKVNLIELNKLNLQILYIPNQINISFITSDVPFFAIGIVKNATLGLEETDQPTLKYIWFPISPKTLGFLSGNVNSSLYKKIHDTTRIKNINLELASSAKEILIAKSQNILGLLPDFKDVEITHLQGELVQKIAHLFETLRKFT